METRDGADVSKEHKVLLNKEPPASKIRYRDNKVVSTKGERYTMEKKKVPGVDEEALKKTYVSITPARKYRFH